MTCFNSYDGFSLFCNTNYEKNNNSKDRLQSFHLTFHLTQPLPFESGAGSLVGVWRREDRVESESESASVVSGTRQGKGQLI